MATREEAFQAALEYYDGNSLSAQTFVDKYALRDDDDFKEKTPDDMHKRLASEFHRIEKQYPNPRSYEEILDSFSRFKYLVPQGSPMAGVGNNYKVTSLSNCYVCPNPEDSISGIIDSAKDMANIMKRRGGVGIDLSNLRPDGMSVSNAAKTTSGAWSFADFYSYVCRMIAQKGRRGALLISMDIKHPDSAKFAVMKLDHKKVTGANVSLRISNEFMRAVIDDTDYIQQWPVDVSNPSYTKTVRARDLWEAIVDSAWESADPGILMWDNMTEQLPAECYVSDGFKSLTTNPCGEIVLSAFDSCRLLAINLASFVDNKFTKNAKFNFKLFKEKVSLGQRMMDNLVDLELEAVERIINTVSDTSEKKMWKRIYQQAYKGRRTGLGTFGLADALACLQVRYDSEDSFEMVESIFSTLRNCAYKESVILAEERGAFPVWDAGKEEGHKFLSRLPLSIRKRMRNVGRRNISILTNAPTGSVAICAFNSSSGIEPVFRNVYKRRKKINDNSSTKKADFIDSLGDRWEEFSVFHRNVADWIRKNDENWDGKTVPELPSYLITSDKIDWENRVKLQGIIQANIDHSISSTINIPADTPKEVVAQIYQTAWKEGLKGVTVYRDGCKDGVLISGTSTPTGSNGRPSAIQYNQAPQRHEVLPCDIYQGRVQGDPWVIIVGLLEGLPYELFGGPAGELDIPKGTKSGYLRKKTGKTSRYDLVYTHYNEEVVAADIGNTFKNKTYGAFTRVLSLSLRHGAPVQHIVEQLGKGESEELTSLSSVLRRALKRYIKDGATVASNKKGCERCGSSNLRYQDGCPVCLDCTFSKCS